MIDDLYKCVSVNSVDIPKAVYLDEDISKAKQEIQKEKARTRAQNDELLGEGGTIKRIEETAARLVAASGISKAEAIKMATELVQTQEERVKVTVTRVEGTAGNPIAGAAAIIAGAVSGQNNPPNPH